MITAIDLLAHLESKIEATLAAGEGVTEGLGELSRMVREIAEAALVRGDDVTLGEARRLAARLGPFFAAGFPVEGVPSAAAARRRVRTCPRCGRRFRRPAGRLEEIGSLLCDECTAELLAGIRL